MTRSSLLRCFNALVLSSLMLGAIACVPAAPEGEAGTHSDNLGGGAKTQKQAAYGEACSVTRPVYKDDIECMPGWVCDEAIRSCLCPLNAPMSGSVCLTPKITGQVWYGHAQEEPFPVAHLIISLLKQDPPLPPTADGVPIPTYTEVETVTSDYKGGFGLGYYVTLEDGIYMVAAKKVGYSGVIARGETAPYALDEFLTRGVGVTIR